jgi:hypothetical protein
MSHIPENAIISLTYGESITVEAIDFPSNVILISTLSYFRTWSDYTYFIRSTTQNINATGVFSTWNPGSASNVLILPCHFDERRS